MVRKMAECINLKDLDNLDIEALEQRLHLAKQMYFEIIEAQCKEEIKTRKKAISRRYVLPEFVCELEKVDIGDCTLETHDRIDSYQERLKNYIRYLDILCRNKKSEKGKVLDRIQKKYQQILIYK